MSTSSGAVTPGKPVDHLKAAPAVTHLRTSRWLRVVLLAERRCFRARAALSRRCLRPPRGGRVRRWTRPGAYQHRPRARRCNRKHEWGEKLAWFLSRLYNRKYDGRPWRERGGSWRLLTGRGHVLVAITAKPRAGSATACALVGPDRAHCPGQRGRPGRAAGYRPAPDRAARTRLHHQPRTACSGPAQDRAPDRPVLSMLARPARTPARPGQMAGEAWAAMPT